MGQQCWPDKGIRAWVTVTLESPPKSKGHRKRIVKKLVADLGCPFEMIVDAQTLKSVKWRGSADQSSNYGWLQGAFVRVVIPALEFAEEMPAYSNPRIVRLMREEGFDGLVGKPFLDRFHWGNGDGGEFCLESWAQYRKR
jgi:hypothetical protein